MIESGRHPCCFGVASGTIRGELLHAVIGICGLVEIIRMASVASVGRAVVIALVTGSAVIGY